MLKKRKMNRDREREIKGFYIPDWGEDCLNRRADRQQGKERKQEIRRTTNVKKRGK
jgi:hypothetical protein